MKKAKIISALIVLLLVLSLLTSCNSTASEHTSRTLSGEQTADPDGTTGTDRNGATEGTHDSSGGNKEPFSKLTLAKDGKTDYTVIFRMGTKGWEKELVLWFRDTFYRVTGAELDIRDDFEAEDEPETLRTDREIVFGTDTTREDCFTYNAEEYKKGYLNFVADERLVLLYGSEAGMYLGICKFFSDAFGVDVSHEETLLGNVDCTLDLDYSSCQLLNNPAFFFIDKEITEYRILVDPSDAIQMRMAYILQRNIYAVTGETLPLSADAPTEGGAEIVLITDKGISKGNWSMTIENDRFTVRASDYYGFTGVARYFQTSVFHGYYPHFQNGFSMTQSYLDTLDEFCGSTAYAYQKTGDVRVMFYNVLFYNPLPAARNVLQAEMIGTYLPDVIGLQEFNHSKRHNAGSNDLTLLLEELGYRETIDPRVKNAYSMSATIPGTDHKGYGTGGSFKVNVDGEVFYTYYNHTPLLYNTNTTTYIDGGYYWYRNQIDAENRNNCGAGDCGSKSLTWGVFEDKKTGERYIVISTHMCTRSEGVRGLQAQEVVALVDGILAQYDLPIIFGGDLNGSLSSINFTTFEERGGFTDLGKSKIAELYSESMGTMHPAPSVTVDPLTGKEYLVNSLSFSQSYSGAVDHIMIKNAKAIRIKVFGIIVDELTGVGSDHLPLFTDFSFEERP